LILNDGSGTRLSANINHVSCPDVTLVKSKSFKFTWKTKDDPCGSDHLPIEISMCSIRESSYTDIRTLNRPKLSFNKMNNELFAVLVSTYMAKIQLDDSIDLLYKKWYEVIFECALKAGAILVKGNGYRVKFDIKLNKKVTYLIKTKKMRLISKPWWDGECQKAVDHRKQSYLNFLKSPNKYNLLRYRQNSNSARNIIKLRKSRNFEKFVNELDPKSNSQNFWEVIKRFRNSEYFSNKEPLYLSKKKTVEDFVDRLAPSGMVYCFKEAVKLNHPSFFDVQFQLEELEELISSAREGSSPGSDFISYSLLKLMPSIAIRLLVKIFNRLLEECYFPKEWREYDVALLPKDNKSDFRPIAMSSCIMKLFEKLVKSRLDRFVELDLLLPGSQYGFRKGRSCEDSIALLLLEIYKDFLNRNPVGVLFLDIKDAYDNVIPSILVDIINDMRIPFQYKKNVRQSINV